MSTSNQNIEIPNVNSPCNAKLQKDLDLNKVL